MQNAIEGSLHNVYAGKKKFDSDKSLFKITTEM